MLTHYKRPLSKSQMVLFPDPQLDTNLVSFPDILDIHDLLDLISLSTGSYVHKQSDSISTPVSDISKTEKTVSFGDPELLLFHNEKLPLYVDKYLFTSVPDIQTEFILEGIGKSPKDFSADLDPSYKFHINACRCGDLLNEYIVPVVRGGSDNPYVRFLSSKASAGGQALKLFDLIGVLHDPADDMLLVECPSFDFITLTFPFEISVLLLSDKTRIAAEKKMWICYNRFFKELRYLFNIPTDHVLGSSASLHVWSTKFPFMPHAHFHSVLPHFSYKKLGVHGHYELNDKGVKVWVKTYDQRLEYELDIDIPDLATYGGRSFEKGRLYQRLYDKIVTMELSRNKFSREKGGDPFSSHTSRDCDGVVLDSGTKRKFHRFISDIPLFQELHNEISIRFSSLIDFSVLDWLGSIEKKSPSGSPYTVRVPFDVDVLRFIWTDIVNTVFDLDWQGSAKKKKKSPNGPGPSDNVSLDFSNPVLYDIYVEFASTFHPRYCRPKLLHFLGYKSRPPVLDMDLFFRSCPGFVVDHNRIDRSAVLSFISDKLAIAHRFNDTDTVAMLDSILSKAKIIFGRYSDTDIIDWLRYLSVHRTVTKTFGFWRQIKRYRVSSVQRKRIPLPRICPICGGDVVTYRYSNDLCINALILHSGSKFHLFTIDKPPPRCLTLDVDCDEDNEELHEFDSLDDLDNDVVVDYFAGDGGWL